MFLIAVGVSATASSPILKHIAATKQGFITFFCCIRCSGGQNVPSVGMQVPQHVPVCRGPSPWGSISALGACWASFFDHSPPVPVFASPSPINLEYLLAVSKNLAHQLHPFNDDGKGGGWKWWEWHFVLLNSHFSAYATCLARKVCGLVRPTWGTSLGEDKLGARDKILNTKVVRRACAGQTFPPEGHARHCFRLQCPQLAPSRALSKTS